MYKRHHKSLICFILAALGGALVCPLLTGCSQDPEQAAAQNVRAATTEALSASVKEQDYAGAKDKVVNALSRHRAQGLTKDSAHLASGNLTLAQARKVQSGLDMKVLPIRSTVNAFEKLLRESESLLLEKERIVALLAGARAETEELNQLINGDGTSAGLLDAYDAAKAELDALLGQKDAVADEMARTQAVLDDYQSRADALMRKAELAVGDKRRELETEGFAMLRDRKAYYIEAQAARNQMTVLDSQIALAQTKADGLAQSIQETRDRMGAIAHSETATALRGQVREIDATLSDHRQRMTSIAGDLEIGMQAYQDEAMEVCGVFENAAAEFESITAREMGFTATHRLGDAHYGAALTCSSFIMLELDVSDRLRDLLETADPAVAASFDEKLPIRDQADPDQVQKAFGYFDQAIEAYGEALTRAGGLTTALAAADKDKGRDAQSSVLRSQVLAVDDKRVLAERIAAYDVADAMTAKIAELRQQGQEYGVSFTQSETLKLIDSGVNYAPSLKINLEVYADDLKQKLSEWKRLPIVEQEAVVAENLETIERAVTQYGEALATQLEPLKQEMLAAQQRGFEEPAPGTASADPNGF